MSVPDECQEYINLPTSTHVTDSELDLPSSSENCTNQPANPITNTYIDCEPSLNIESELDLSSSSEACINQLPNPNTNTNIDIYINSEQDLFESPCESPVSSDFESHDQLTEAYFFMPGKRGDYNEIKLNSQTDDDDHEDELHGRKVTYDELLTENQMLKKEIISLKAELELFKANKAN